MTRQRRMYYDEIFLTSEDIFFFSWSQVGTSAMGDKM